MATQDDIFDLSNNTQANAYLSGKKKNNDGLLRPSLTEGSDGKRELVIRLLPNLTQEGKLGPTAIEKHIHYADFKNEPGLQGYFDCLKNANIGKDCPLCNTYWALKNSKNPTEQDKAKLINRSIKYYAYAYVVEDKQVPENEGKIFIFPFGYKIFQKIKAKAESTRKPCKVEDLVYGANLNLVIQEVATFYNYDASEFEAPEPITINGVPLKVGADGKIPADERARIVEFLKDRQHNLEEFLAVDWTAEQHDKVNRIIAMLAGTSYDASSASTPKAAAKTPLTSSSVFSDDDDEDDEPKAAAKPAKETKAPVKESKPAEPATDDVKIDSAKKKVKTFFEDED